MLEYFTYKKVKKHREEKAEKQRLGKDTAKEDGKGNEKKNGDGSSKPNGETAKSPSPVSPPDETRPILDQEDEKFLEQLTSPSTAWNDGDDETPPPLPPRVKTPVIDLDSDASSFASKDDSSITKPPTKDDGKGKDKTKDGDKDHKPKRFSFANISLKRKPHKSKDASSSQHLAVPNATAGAGASASDLDPEQEIRKESLDVARVLEDLNLAASQDNKAFSLSRESAETVRRFTQVLKDLVNGVPTAYGDLVRLIEDRDGVLARSYEKLPRSLKKLVAHLPEKLTSSLAPELLAVAAEAQGLAVGEAAEGGAKKLLSPSNLMELITKPGAVVGLLKGIVNALKVRWPAFVGTNVLWSVAVFLLLSALWYCYKRGRETRLEKEAEDAATAAVGGERVTEVVDGEEVGQQQQIDGTTPRIEVESGIQSPVPAATAAK
ncbi:hypothetical protein Hte_004429 [Hypoxylon texense]